MINIYEDIKDASRNVILGRTKLFIEETDAEGNIMAYSSGTSIIPDTSGTLLIVDDWLIPQIDKLLFIDGTLVVKEGEAIEKPVKSETELKEEELLRQLAELRAQRNEPAPE